MSDSADQLHKKYTVIFDEMSEQEFNKNDIRVGHKPEYRENEWSGNSLDTFLEIMEKDQWSSLDTFLENMEKEAEQEELRKYNESVESVLEAQKTDPDYFEKLVRAQFTGLIVPPVDK